MKLHELDPAFVARLENWGLYYTPRPKQEVSPTYRVCLQLAVAAGKEIRAGYAESRPRLEIDAEDAKIIEWCFAMSSYRLPAQDRALIKAHYVSRSDPRMVCRVLQMRFLSWEKALCEAVVRFQQAVEMLEGCKVMEKA